MTPFLPATQDQRQTFAAQCYQRFRQWRSSTNERGICRVAGRIGYDQGRAGAENRDTHQRPSLPPESSVGVPSKVRAAILREEGTNGPRSRNPSRSPALRRRGPGNVRAVAAWCSSTSRTLSISHDASHAVTMPNSAMPANMSPPAMNLPNRNALPDDRPKMAPWPCVWGCLYGPPKRARSVR